MSHSHIRIQGHKEPERNRQPRLWIIGSAFVMIGLLFAVGPIWTPNVEDAHQTTQGQVLETRIAVRGTTESRFGGRILYCIEVHVLYALNGQVQNRWMTASGVTSNRDALALKLVKQPKMCEVYWVAGHPENPKCLLR